MKKVCRIILDHKWMRYVLWFIADLVITWVLITLLWKGLFHATAGFIAGWLVQIPALVLGGILADMAMRYAAAKRYAEEHDVAFSVAWENVTSEELW